MTRRFEVHLDGGVGHSPRIVRADKVYYSQDTGWLIFHNEGTAHHAVFAPGKWVFFKEVTQ